MHINAHCRNFGKNKGLETIKMSTSKDLLVLVHLQVTGIANKAQLKTFDWNKT